MNQKKAQAKGKIWVILSLLISLAAGGFFYYRRKNQTPDTNYIAMQATKQKIRQTILTTGVVQPENRLEIKPPVAGRIEEVLITEGAQVKKGQIIAWMSSTERAALLDAARSKGAAEVKRWEGLYRPTPIMAPINGTIILRNVEAGQTFTGQDSVFVMSNRLTIRAQVDETDLAQIKTGQSASIILDAYPKESLAGQVGKLAFDAKTVNNVTSYLVDVLPLVTPDFMRSGMTANVSFLISEKLDALTIPSEAIKYKDNQAEVLVTNPADPKKPIERAIKLGITDGKQTEVIEGLKEGETILVADIKILGEGKGPSSNPFTPFGGGGPRRGGR